MRRLILFGLLAGIAGCAAGPQSVRSTTSAASATPPTSDLEGLLVRFFRCANGAAFTTQNFPDGRFRLTTREAAYDLRPSGAAFVGQGVTYRRQGTAATLVGAAGGPYVDCVQS